MQSLDGIWDFGFIPGMHAEPFFDSSAAVPGCADAAVPFHGRRGTAFYRRSVCAGGMVRLSLTAGLHSRVFWDGREVGASVLPWTREYHTFDAEKDGQHELMIITDNLPDESPSSMFHAIYDFYGYCGIYDTVELEKLHPGMIDSVRIIPLDCDTGEIQIELSCHEVPPDQLTCSFDDKESFIRPYEKQFNLRVPDCRLWTPENPCLHTLTLNGKTTVFGMRRLDWSGEHLLLNGKKLKLAGVCRHEAHPEFGAATPPALIWNDLLMIKRSGCNFIRGSHYPQKEIMLDFADHLGLMVWDEALGWGNKTDQLADPVFADRQEEQCIKMVRRSINHPSVIMWGFLNECASDSQAARDLIARLKTAVRREDSSRPVTFASNRWQKDICLDLADIISLNVYPDWYDDNEDPENLDHTHELLRKIAGHFSDKPLIISEIGCAALRGDHSGYRWSEEFQARHAAAVLHEILNQERYTGVSLWQFCDTRSYHTTQYALSRPRGFNNKGLLDEYRRPKLAWRTLENTLAADGPAEKRLGDHHDYQPSSVNDMNQQQTGGKQ